MMHSLKKGCLIPEQVPCHPLGRAVWGVRAARTASARTAGAEPDPPQIRGHGGCTPQPQVPTRSPARAPRAGRVTHRVGGGRTLGPVRYFRSIIRHSRVVTSPIFSTIASALSPILMWPILLSSLLRHTLTSPVGKVQLLAWLVKVNSFLSAS